MSRQIPSSTLVVGTRGSLLARAQSAWVIERLAEAHRGLDVQMCVIRTTGDKLRGRPLPEIGGKGLFTLELETALRDERIDLAVHSAKDLPTELGEGLEIAAMPPREDSRDAWVSADGSPLEKLATGSTVGTSSLRRQAQLRMRCGELRFVNLRGNVDTRLKKIGRGDCAGAVLAMAGLIRAGLADHVTHPLDPADFIPAPGQGALALETRVDDAHVRDLLAVIHDHDTQMAVECERGVLAALDAGCHAPVAVHAVIAADGLRCRALVADPSGRRVATADVRTGKNDPHECITRVVAELRRGGADAIIAACRSEPLP